MAFRLPTLTMAVCGALCVPQLASYAQQPITETTPPIVQVRVGGDHDSANPLRHHGCSRQFRGSATGYRQYMRPAAGSPSSQNSIPSSVRQALYPNLPAEGHLTPSTVRPVAHLEPVNCCNQNAGTDPCWSLTRNRSEHMAPTEFAPLAETGAEWYEFGCCRYCQLKPLRSSWRPSQSFGQFGNFRQVSLTD